MSPERTIVAGTDWGGLAVIRSLGRRGIPVTALAASHDEYGRTSRYVDESLIAPHPREEQEFVDFLIRNASRWSGALLIHTTDHALTTLSKHRDVLREHYRLTVPDWEHAKLFIDKAYTYEIARGIGVAAPMTLTPTSAEEAETFAQSAQFPCVVKPNQVHLFQQRFGKKMFPVWNQDELTSRYLQAQEAGIDVMIQEFIPGDDSNNVNFNSYIWPGGTPVEFTARKVRNAPPRYGSPRLVVSERIPEVSGPALRLLHRLGYEGFSCTEFKYDDRDQQFKLMEVNGRHHRSGALSIRCGIDFPWIEYAHRVLGEDPSPTTFEEGVYWIDIMSDVKHGIRHFRDERYTPREYLRPYFRPHIFDVFDRDDLRPFLRRAFRKPVRAFRRRRTRME